MKTTIFCIALLLGSAGVLSAQDFYLPVSTHSEIARRAYQAASSLGSNIRNDAAKASIDKALEADPAFFMAYVYDYQVLANDGEKPALIEKALAIDPGGFTKAEKIMRRQLEAWKADPKASPAEAMKALVAAYPNTPEAWEWAYLHAFYTDKDNAAGLKYASKLIELAPDFPPVYNSLGYHYLGTKEMDKAKANFEKYLQLAPAEPNAYDSMGEFFLTTGNNEKSAEYYDMAVVLGMEASRKGAEKAREAMGEKAGNANVLLYKTGNPADWPRAQDAVVAAPKNHKILLENEHVRVLEVTLLPNELEPVHHHRWPSVLYIMEAGDFIDRDAEGNVIMDSRQLPEPLVFPMTMWKDAEAPHSVENLSDTKTIRLIRVESKQ